MQGGSLWINGEWCPGQGAQFESHNPCSDTKLWVGESASMAQVAAAVTVAKAAAIKWAKLSWSKRAMYLERYISAVHEQSDILVEIISSETGKPFWEAKTEVNSLLSKLDISKQAFELRCGEMRQEGEEITCLTRFKPHGVLAVLGPFNFPAHIPNSHIIPALLAGNTVIFKPSELTPKVAEWLVLRFEQIGLPPGVVNLLQGDGAVGKCLVEQPELNGVLFTGGSKTGLAIQASSINFPGRVVALEMGGNNPLLVHPPYDLPAALNIIIQSAFLTAGQRCTTARRLILIESSQNKTLVEALMASIQKLIIGPPELTPEPFMGPLIDASIAQRALTYQARWQTIGGKLLLPLKEEPHSHTMLSPGVIDMTNILDRPDVECFGPLLQVVWVRDLEHAILEANRTQYGLSAGLICEERQEFDRFYEAVRAGIINWNRPTTGASGQAPFGGIGLSGNYRPSGFFAADYCSYPVVSQCAETLTVPEQLCPGVQLVV